MDVTEAIWTSPSRAPRRSRAGSGKPDAPVTSCTGSQGPAQEQGGECILPEDVCDGQDNNCDGKVDEDFVDPVTGLYTSNQECEVRDKLLCTQFQ